MDEFYQIHQNFNLHIDMQILIIFLTDNDVVVCFFFFLFFLLV